MALLSTRHQYRWVLKCKFSFYNWCIHSFRFHLKLPDGWARFMSELESWACCVTGLTKALYLFHFAAIVQAHRGQRLGTQCGSWWYIFYQQLDYAKKIFKPPPPKKNQQLFPSPFCHWAVASTIAVATCSVLRDRASFSGRTECENEILF